MAQLLSHLIVALTAFSTVLAGVPSRMTADDMGSSCVVSAQAPANGDEGGKPRGEHDSEESEEENEFEVKLLAERAVVCGPRCDTFVSLDPADRAGSRQFFWPTTLIRGPPASA